MTPCFSRKHFPWSPPWPRVSPNHSAPFQVPASPAPTTGGHPVFRLPAGQHRAWGAGHTAEPGHSLPSWLGIVFG